MEDSKSPSKHGLVVFVQTVGKAATGTEVVTVRLDQPTPDIELIAHQGAPERSCARRQQRRNLRAGDDVVTSVGGDEVRVDIVSIHEHPDHLIPQSQEQREARMQLPVVLNEQRPVVGEGVHRHIAARVALLPHLVG